MRRMFCCLAVSVTLVGSLVCRANAQMSDAARAAVSPSVVRECREMIAKKYPQVTIVGKFFLAGRRQGHGSIIARLADPGEVVAVAAPSTNVNVFGSTIRAYAGCMYVLKDGALSFREIVGASSFPPRYKLEPGEK